MLEGNGKALHLLGHAKEEKDFCNMLSNMLSNFFLSFFLFFTKNRYPVSPKGQENVKVAYEDDDQTYLVLLCIEYYTLVILCA